MVIKMYGEIEIKNKKNLTKRIIDAINNRENVFKEFANVHKNE